MTYTQILKAKASWVDRDLTHLVLIDLFLMFPDNYLLDFLKVLFAIFGRDDDHFDVIKYFGFVLSFLRVETAWDDPR